MLRSVLLAGSIVFVSFAVLAADPTPKSDVHEKVENIRQSGALKVHHEPTVLRQQDDDLPATVPATNPTTGRTESAAVPEAEKKSTDSSTDHRSSSSGENLFGVHAALGFPHPLSVGVDYVAPSRLFSAGLEAGSYSGKYNDIRAKIDNVEVALRYHPFAGSFFLGALAGTQKVHGEEPVDYAGQTATARADVKGNYVTPHVGWLWGIDHPGFFASFELGYQISSGVTTDVSSDADPIVQATPDYQNAAADVKDKAEKVGKMGLPYVGLFKFGWLF